MSSVESLSETAKTTLDTGIEFSTSVTVSVVPVSDVAAVVLLRVNVFVCPESVVVTVTV